MPACWIRKVRENSGSICPFTAARNPSQVSAKYRHSTNALHSVNMTAATQIPPLESSASSTTANGADLESQRIETKVSHFSLILDQTGITEAVLKYNYAGNGTSDSPYLVEFLPNDPRNALNFPQSKKWTITVLQAIATLAVTFASTAYSGGLTSIIMEFNVSTEVVILGISMFVLGFAIGPLFWAPLSELYGRQIPFFFSYLALTAFNAGAAGAPTMAALIVLRFFAGSFGSSPLTNAGGVIADMFEARERGLATALFAMAPFLGPTIGMSATALVLPSFSRSQRAQETLLTTSDRSHCGWVSRRE